MSRSQNTPEKQALKAASKALVRAAGGIEAAAEFTRPGKTLLSDYGRPEGDCFMPVDVVADLEGITRGGVDWPIVTRFLATRAGCALIALPDASPLDDDWFSVIARLSSELGDVTKGICEAARDGRVTPSDVRQHKLRQECDDAIGLLVNLRARFDQIATQGDVA